MLIRRHLVLGAAACGTLAPTLVACSSSTGEQEAARVPRRPIAAQAGDRSGLKQELVRYATPAPSSHNTQCWAFHLQDRAILITPDPMQLGGRTLADAMAKVMWRGHARLQTMCEGYALWTAG